jgi:hypothetical protein
VEGNYWEILGRMGTARDGKSWLGDMGSNTGRDSDSGGLDGIPARVARYSEFHNYGPLRFFVYLLRTPILTAEFIVK